MLMGLCHESCVHVVLQGRLAHGALEQEHLIGKLKGIAMVEIDFKLGRAAFMGQRINIQFLGFAVIVNILNDGIKIIGRVNAISLATGLLAALAADSGFYGVIGIEVFLAEIELQFRRDNRTPPLGLVKGQHAPQYMARRDLNGFIIEMKGIADHLCGRLSVPGNHARGFWVRLHIYVDGTVAHCRCF